MQTSPKDRFTIPTPVRAVLIVALLYLFLVGVKLLEGGINGLGSDIQETLFQGVSNPIAGLCVGILGTVLVQSSSVSTSTIVGLVAAGVIDVSSAVPMIMGANIGTTVTNSLVALAHVRNTEEFRLAFTAATMHDFFNFIAVAALLPLELTTKFLSGTAEWISEALTGSEGLGGSFDSPIKGAVKWLASLVEDGVDAVFSGETLVAVIGIVIGIAFIFLTLAFITKNMRLLVADRIERSLNAALARSGLIGMAVGMLVTVAVQSSSITTSILVPIVASGVLLVRNAYPITLGANIGTTVTALLAALGAGAVDGLTIAVTHTLFNVVAIALFYPLPQIRYIPVRAAEWLAGQAMGAKRWAFAYVLGMFVVLPLVGIVIFR
ncbi:MAG: Na/Pi symporter [Acidimicrobiia bacterium]